MACILAAANIEGSVRTNAAPHKLMWGAALLVSG